MAPIITLRLMMNLEPEMRIICATLARPLLCSLSPESYRWLYGLQGRPSCGEIPSSKGLLPTLAPPAPYLLLF